MVRQPINWAAWLIVGIVFCMPTSTVDALQSTNYRFDDSTISSGSMLQSSSTNYQTLDGISDIAVGNATSSNFQVEAGSQTTYAPWLSFTVTPATNFDAFSPATTATATTTFSVLNYTSYGYIVQISGPPPTSSGHTIAPMTISGPSQTGIEQFGINLVANTSPTSLGANPDNGQFGYGSVATTNYGTSNVYRYVDGEIIAEAPKSSGITNYTISYIVNVTPLTAGGTYTTQQSLIVVGTY